MILEPSIINPQKTGLKLISKAMIIKVARVFLALYSSILKTVAKAITTRKRIRNCHFHLNTLLTANFPPVTKMPENPDG